MAAYKTDVTNAQDRRVQDRRDRCTVVRAIQVYSDSTRRCYTVGFDHIIILRYDDIGMFRTGGLHWSLVGSAKHCSHTHAITPNLTRIIF